VMDASDLHVCHRYPITLLPPERRASYAHQSDRSACGTGPNSR
jgi:hypothetical protein